MNEKILSKIRSLLREASYQGFSGFMYDNNKSENEQDVDWMYFENMCIGEIEDLELNLKFDALKEAFISDEDIHERIAKEQGISRSQVKAINFGVLYGD